MYLGQFFDPTLMQDLAEDAQAAYDEAVDMGPEPMDEEQVVTEPAPAPVPAKAGMSTTTMLLIGGALLWLVFKKK